MGGDSQDREGCVPSLGNPHKVSGLRRVGRAFFHSLEGLGTALKHESAFRQEALLASLLVPAAVFLSFSLSEKLILIGAVALVLITELLNTAIECCIDYISLEHHPVAKRAKDLGSAAVFLSLAFCAVAWLLLILSNWPLSFEFGF